MTITNSGNVGIGITSPTTKLDISGRGITFNRDSEYGQFIDFKRNNINKWQIHAGIGNNDDVFSIRNGSNTSFLSILQGGNIGIGITNPSEKLTVDGNILCEEVKVILDVTAPDYVFEKYYNGHSILKADYVMPTLEEIEVYTKTNHHLPEVPSAATLKEDGLELKNMSMILLQKIEELTLYTIEQEKRIKALEAQIVK